MAFTYGTQNIKIVNIANVEINSVDYSGDNIKDGISFVDAQNSEIKMASGNAMSTSEKTTMSMDLNGLATAVIDTLQLLSATAQTVIIKLTNGRTITLTGILNVLKISKGNEPVFVTVSLEQNAYDVDTISVLAEA